MAPALYALPAGTFSRSLRLDRIWTQSFCILREYVCLRALRVCLGGFVYAYYGLEYLCIGVGVCILGVEVAVYKNQYLL